MKFLDTLAPRRDCSRGKREFFASLRRRRKRQYLIFSFSHFLIFKILLVLATTSIQAQPLKHGRPDKVGIDSKRLQRVDTIIESAIAQGDIPGAVLAVVRHDKIAYLKAYGNRQVWPVVRPMTTNTIFDMASCSKAMSTALSALILCEEGKFRMLDPVNRYIPDFENWIDETGETTTIRIHHLMTHTSGLPAY